MNAVPRPCICCTECGDWVSLRDVGRITGRFVCARCLRRAEKPLSAEQAVMRMEACLSIGDVEVAHGRADEILIERLRALGEHELCRLYEQVDKWYA